MLSVGIAIIGGPRHRLVPEITQNRLLVGFELDVNPFSSRRSEPQRPENLG